MVGLGHVVLCTGNFATSWDPWAILVRGTTAVTLEARGPAVSGPCVTVDGANEGHAANMSHVFVCLVEPGVDMRGKSAVLGAH